ncbi:hypothetical protein MMC11_008053 [Xylographa trunciseda]|nr:hypothetical protein [Xylographa trunciseda]
MDSKGEDLKEVQREMLKATFRLQGLRTLEIRIFDYIGTERWEAFKLSLQVICEALETLQSAMLLGRKLYYGFDDDGEHGTSHFNFKETSWRDMTQMTRTESEEGTTTWMVCDGLYDAAYSRVVTEYDEDEFLMRLRHRHRRIDNVSFF